MECLKVGPADYCMGFRELPGSTLSLPEQLRAQYGQRWDILVEALFMSAPAQRASLLNPFMHHEDHEELMRFRNIVLYQLVDQVPEAFYRNINNGLLNQYWCYPAAVLPVLFANPQPKSKVLVLGASPSSRLLGLCYLLLGSEATLPSSDVVSKDSKSPVRGAQPKAVELQPRKALPWNVYGQGRPPPGWQYSNEIYGEDGEPMSPAHQSWGLQRFLENMLARSVRAGCCTVRTTSGDWAELAEQALQERANIRTSLSGPPSSPGSKSPKRAKSRGALELENAVRDPLLTIKHCSSEFSALVGRMFEHHIPTELHPLCRLEQVESKSALTAESDRVGDKDLVIVEAPCSADESEVRAVCRQGQNGTWPNRESQAIMREQQAMFFAGFKELRVGGRMLYCSMSLAKQETDDVVVDCSGAVLRSIRVLGPADFSDSEGAQLAVSAKKFGLERTQFGWRMLPDLAFQKPQYFSILERTA